MRLKDKTKGLNGGKGIDFMEGRTKGEVKTLLGAEITVNGYGFINGKYGEVIVFKIEENDKEFFFGNNVMTDKFKEFTKEEKAEIEANGIPVRITEKKNEKGNRTYYNIEFYPEED